MNRRSSVSGPWLYNNPALGCSSALLSFPAAGENEIVRIARTRWTREEEPSGLPMAQGPLHFRIPAWQPGATSPVIECGTGPGGYAPRCARLPARFCSFLAIVPLGARSVSRPPPPPAVNPCAEGKKRVRILPCCIPGKHIHTYPCRLIFALDGVCTDTGFYSELVSHAISLFLPSIIA